MPLTVGICDDCAEQVDLLMQYTNDCLEEDEFFIIHSTEPEEFLEKVKCSPPDLVFLDMDMEKMNGIQLGEAIRALYEDTVIVYITAYEKYALEAFGVRAFHYLLKPLEKETFSKVLKEALKWIKKNRQNKPQKVFTVQKKGETVSVPYNDICYFEKTGHKVRIHTGQSCIDYYGNFTDLLAEIGRDSFVQCHQGYIANVLKIRAFRDKTLYLDGDLELPVSRTYAEATREMLAKRLFAGEETI
jgi:DNA-binding LytR/AlgR family response regulator